MDKKTIAWIVAGVVALGFVLLTTVVVTGGVVYFILKNQQGGVNPTPQPVSITTEIARILDGNPADAARIQAVYTAMANVLEKDTEGIIKSTEDVRQANGLVGRLAYGTELKGKYPGLATAVDNEIIRAIGRQRVELSSDMKAKCVQAFRDIARGASEANN